MMYFKDYRASFTPYDFAVVRNEFTL